MISSGYPELLKLISALLEFLHDLVALLGLELTISINFRIGTWM